jgi:hypothetical protein
MNALVTLVEKLEVASLQLVNKPRRQFNMWDVLAAGRCTPQLTAAQHMQADVVRGR